MLFLLGKFCKCERVFCNAVYNILYTRHWSKTYPYRISCCLFYLNYSQVQNIWTLFMTQPNMKKIRNSMKIQNALVSNILDRSQRYFAHVTTVTLSWRVQNIVVIGSVYFTLECFEFSSNFEFDRNMLSGAGARDDIEVISMVVQDCNISSALAVFH